MSGKDQTLNRIAVGVDGSPQSIAALSWATTLAEESGAKVTAIMSWNYPTSLLLPVVGAPVLPSDSMTAATRDTLAEIVRGHSGASLVDEMRTPMGSPRSVLVEASEDHDLVVLGRTGRGRIERLLLGSTASYTARHARCPVALVETETIPRRLTVAIDGSVHSTEALSWALSLPGSRDVVAVYSHDESVLDELPLSSEQRQPFEEGADVVVQEAVERAASMAGVDVERVRTEIRTGDPRTSIVEAADPDGLLIMGARGHSGLSAWVLGSLADFAVQHCAAPLIIWNPA